MLGTFELAHTWIESSIKMSRVRFLRQNADNKVGLILEMYSQDATWIDICTISSICTDKPISLTCLGLLDDRERDFFMSLKLHQYWIEMLTIWWVLSISASGSFAHREIEDKHLFIRVTIWPERLNLLRSLSLGDSLRARRAHLKTSSYSCVALQKLSPYFPLLYFPRVFLNVTKLKFVEFS